MAVNRNELLKAWGEACCCCANSREDYPTRSLDIIADYILELREKLYGNECPMCEDCPHGCKLEEVE